MTLEACASSLRRCCWTLSEVLLAGLRQRTSAGIAHQEFQNRGYPQRGTTAYRAIQRNPFENLRRSMPNWAEPTSHARPDTVTPSKLTLTFSRAASQSCALPKESRILPFLGSLGDALHPDLWCGPGEIHVQARSSDRASKGTLRDLGCPSLPEHAARIQEGLREAHVSTRAYG